MLGRERIKQIVESHPMNFSIKNVSDPDRLVQWLEDVLTDYFEYLLERERNGWADVEDDNKSDET